MEPISVTNKQRKNLNNGDLWLKTAFGFANSIHSLGDGWFGYFFFYKNKKTTCRHKVRKNIYKIALEILD